MPNRIIKESIHTSESVNQMTDFQFRLWVSLITAVDDFGRFDARPAIIRGTCFPLRERLTIKDIEAALTALADIGCVGLYEVDGKPYLYLPHWESHQRIRQKISKYPDPFPDCPENQSAAICGNSPQSAATCGLNPNPESESRIQNPESESEITTTTKRACAHDPDGWEKVKHEYEQDFAAPIPTDPRSLTALYEAHNTHGTDFMTEVIAAAGMAHPKGDPCSYVLKALKRLEEKGITTVEAFRKLRQEHDAAPARAERSRSKPKNPALEYEQRTYTDSDFEDMFVDLDHYEDGTSA